MARRSGGRSFFSLPTLLASFFGAAMIAGAFAYFNYKFSEYKFINFKEWVFYEKSDIFKPADKRYLIVFYSSKDKQTLQKLLHVKTKTKIVAIDYYNTIQENTKYITFIRSGTNTALKFIQRFNIYECPSIFIIKKYKGYLYKQDSMIRKLDDLDMLIEE